MKVDLQALAAQFRARQQAAKKKPVVPQKAQTPDLQKLARQMRGQSSPRTQAPKARLPESQAPKASAPQLRPQAKPTGLRSKERSRLGLLRTVDLFSGVGGFTIGAVSAGCPMPHGVEKAPVAVRTARQHGHRVEEMDVGDFGGMESPFGTDLLIGGPPCFQAGTMILTYERGFVPIEQVIVGDLVLTHLGRWRSVTSVMTRSDQPLRKIQAQGVPGVACTDEHPFYARGRTQIPGTRSKSSYRAFSDPDWLPASSVTKDHFVSQVLPDEKRNDRHNESFWWIVGRYLADGWYTKRYNRPETSSRIYICASTKKADVLEARLRDYGFNPARQNASKKRKNVVRFEISNRELYLFLKPFGKYAHGKTIPGFVFELPIAKVKSLMDGYLTGDGHREKNSRGSGSHLSFRTVSKSLALGFSLLSQRAFGVVASVRFEKRAATKVIEGRTVNQRPNYVAQIPERNRSGFIDGRYGWKKVKSNIDFGRGDVYNLSVEEDESYVADGAVVHNCQPFSSAGARGGKYDPRDGFKLVYNVIDELQPRRVVFENVPDFLLGKNAAYAKEVLDNLGSRFAAVGVWKINAKDFGVPQDRERVFIWAAERPMAPPVPTHGPRADQPYKTVRQALPTSRSRRPPSWSGTPRRSRAASTSRRRP